MTLMTVAECVTDSRTSFSHLGVRVEEFARGCRVRVTDAHASWVLVLPTDGFEFDLMQYQISSDDAAHSAVLELKMNGEAYRDAVAGIDSSSSPQAVLAALRVLLQPILPLFGLLHEHNQTDIDPAVSLRSVTG